jgi:hypothetical protein
MESIPPCWNTSAPSRWNNVVPYGQYILDRKLVRRRRPLKKGALSIQIYVNLPGILNWCVSSRASPIIRSPRMEMDPAIGLGSTPTLRLYRLKFLDYFFTPKTPSFAALATRNLTTVLAGILIFCCVLGLKPVRAFLFHQLAKAGQNEFAVLFTLLIRSATSPTKRLKRTANLSCPVLANS